MVGFVIWNIISTIIFGAQTYYEYQLVQTVLKLNILPQRYLMIFMGVMAAALVFSFLLLYVKQSRKIFWRLLRTIIAILLCVIMVLAGIVGTDLVDTLYSSLTELSAATHPGSVIGIYVLKDDPAHSLEDAQDYVFTYGEDFDSADSRQTLYKIGEALGRSVQSQTEPTVLDSIDHLYDGSCGALIMNEVYVSVLEATADNAEDNYGDFSERTRLLWEFSLEESAVSVVENGDDGQAQTTEDDGIIDVTKDVFVVYLSGADVWGEIFTTSRSDVNILAVVNPVTRQVLLINTPRDYFIPNSISPDGSRDKLTHCGIYGINCSMDTLGNLYGMHTDYYAQINFTGFERLIDAVGGVTVYSEVAFENNNVKIREGENHLNGKEALGFARERHRLANGDNDRGQNQMRVIRGLIDKFTSPSILQNYNSILKSVEGMMLTDFPVEDITKLVKLQLDEGGSWDVLSTAATGSASWDYTYSMPRTKLWVMEPNQDSVDKISSLIQRMRDGETLTQSDLSIK